MPKGYAYAAGFVRLNRIAFSLAAASLPARELPLAKFFLLEGALRANWEAGFNGNQRDVLSLQRGQFPMGIDEMAKTLGTSPRKIRTLLRDLQSVGEITSKMTNRGSIITICNYDAYVGLLSENDKQTTSRRQADDNSKEEEEVQEVPPHPRGERELPSKNKRDTVLDQMAELWTAIPTTAQNGQVPYSMLGRWRKNYPDDLIIECLEQILYRDEPLEKPTGYIAAMLRNKLIERQQNSAAEADMFRRMGAKI